MTMQLCNDLAPHHYNITDRSSRGDHGNYVAVWQTEITITTPTRKASGPDNILTMSYVLN